MRLKISHTTEYSYDEPVTYVLQRLRLTPYSQPGQTVLSWETRVDGARLEVGYDDHFGNRVQLVSVNAEQNAIRIVASGEVETEDKAGVYGAHQGYTPLWLYLRETPLTKKTKPIRNMAKSTVGDTDLARMHQLMAEIHERVEYRPGETGTETTAEQALQKRQRRLSGPRPYLDRRRPHARPARTLCLRLPDDGRPAGTGSHPRLGGSVPLNGLGWVGFDAANKMCPDDRWLSASPAASTTRMQPRSPASCMARSMSN